MNKEKNKEEKPSMTSIKQNISIAEDAERNTTCRRKTYSQS
jgi:hypothetical protein